MAWDTGPNSEPAERTTVVVSRHWNNPQITITLNRDKIEVVCGLADFVSALAIEMPHPVKTWSRKQQHKQALDAMLTAIEKIKQSTAQVM